MAFFTKKVASPTQQSNGVAVVPNTNSGYVQPGSIQMQSYQNTGMYNNKAVFSVPQSKPVAPYDKRAGVDIATRVPIVLKRQGN